jgi:Fe-S cluster assembly ATP-binding protein
LPDLEIRNLHVRAADKEILKGLDLEVSRGEIHALMGPNGSGKSTLANTILGHPAYEITEGEIRFRGQDLTEADPENRAQAGLFLAFQYPAAIPGVSVANFLRMAVNTRRDEPIGVREFGAHLRRATDLLRVERDFTSRHLNDGFSGGEKKRCEILQMAMLEPEVAVLDETDSGLDIDALRTVAEGVNTLHAQTGMGALIITHYQRILHHVTPDFVHVMLDGRIVREGGPELVDQLEREGYDWLRDGLEVVTGAPEEDDV